jgi:hypothetical protein
MKTYEEILNDSEDRMPFSNADAGYAWMEQWCERGPCVHEPDCPLLLLAMENRTPQEWQYRIPNVQNEQYTCTEHKEA